MRFKEFHSHGSGQFQLSDFLEIGKSVVIENGVLVFHPENIRIGSNVYVGHYTILKGYHKNILTIGSGTWIGQQCFFHSGGGISIGQNVGIGPGVKIISSSHNLSKVTEPILHSEILFKEVTLEDDCDIGVGAIILPGVHIGRGAQVAAGAVVTSNVEDFSIVAGVPARLVRFRI